MKKRAIEINPSSDMYYNLGNAYDEKGMFGEAVYAWKDALNIDPDIMDAHFNLGIAYDKNEMYKEAIDEYKQILARKPKDAEALYWVSLERKIYEGDEPEKEFSVVLPTQKKGGRSASSK